MAIYMKYGAIKGTTTTEGFKDWCELSSAQFGAGRGIGSARGKGVNREASEPSLSEITVTKEWDPVSSVKFFEASVAGKMNTEVHIKFTTTNGTQVGTFLHVKLTECGISGYSMSSGGDKPTESLSLNFAKIEITPYSVDEDFKETKGDVVSYDLVAMKAA